MLKRGRTPDCSAIQKRLDRHFGFKFERWRVLIKDEQGELKRRYSRSVVSLCHTPCRPHVEGINFCHHLLDSRLSAAPLYACSTGHHVEFEELA